MSNKRKCKSTLKHIKSIKHRAHNVNEEVGREGGPACLSTKLGKWTQGHLMVDQQDTEILIQKKSLKSLKSK